MKDLDKIKSEIDKGEYYADSSGGNRFSALCEIALQLKRIADILESQIISKKKKIRGESNG